jgi:hypothetical protein
LNAVVRPEFETLPVAFAMFRLPIEVRFETMLPVVAPKVFRPVLFVRLRVDSRFTMDLPLR